MFRRKVATSVSNFKPLNSQCSPYLSKATLMGFFHALSISLLADCVSACVIGILCCSGFFLLVKAVVGKKGVGSLHQDVDNVECLLSTIVWNFLCTFF